MIWDVPELQIVRHLGICDASKCWNIEFWLALNWTI
jgi:hypothetical protein